MLLLVSQEDIALARSIARRPRHLPLVNTFFPAEFERSLGSAVPASGKRRVRDVIQFKNHSLSAWAEISFFIRENTSRRASSGTAI